MFRVLLYYNFTPIQDTQAFRDAHFAKCQELGLKGRVYVAAEGINGTVSGTLAATQAYKEYVQSLDGFAGIHWKEDEVSEIPFAKLKVKIRPYLVAFGPGNEVDMNFRGRHLTPQEWRDVLDQAERSGEDVVVLDIRNNYESEVGRFKNAIRPPLEAFSDFPQWVKELAPYKDKKVLTYCTGGIRCEKFTALLVKEGFQDVNQLYGGILNYVKEEGMQHFEGRCFVFDDRLSVSLDPSTKPIAKCHHCGTPEDRYVNCSNMTCNKLFIVCDSCAQSWHGACGSECRESPGRRPFDPKNFRIPYRKKGVVFPELGLAEKTKIERGLTSTSGSKPHRD